MFDQTEMKTVIVVSTDCYDDDDDYAKDRFYMLITNKSIVQCLILWFVINIS